MRVKYIIAVATIMFALINPVLAKTHLFIMSGQSNMKHLDPTIFKEMVTKAFPDDEVIVVKDAQSGRPIRDWYFKWKSLDGKTYPRQGKLYTRLMGKVKPAIKGKKLDSVTFVWMQGEADAKEYGREYSDAFKALMQQLRDDLKYKDINFVLGRISDFGLKDDTRPYWKTIRETEVKLAEENPRGEWVDTDDLNGKKDGLHYDKKGYEELNKRFAAKAIALVKKHDAK